MRPINGNVLVKDLKKEEVKTESGIYIPSNASTTFVRSEVIAFDENIEILKKGDTVKVMGNHIGQPFEENGEQLRFIKVGAILEIED